MSNKFPMTRIRFHFFYIALILFLGYKYFSKTKDLNALTKSLESSCKQQLLNIEIINASSDYMLDEIKANIQRRPVKYSQVLSNIKNLMTERQAIKKLIIDYRKDILTLYSLGEPLIDNPHSPAFITDNRINDLRLQLSHLQSALKTGIDSTRIDSITAQTLFKRYQLPELLNDSEYWQNFNHLSRIQAYSELVRIENIISADIIFHLNYIHDLTSSCGFRFDEYKAIIAPKKNFVTEGESFEGEVFITPYANLSHYGDVVSISVNGMNVPILDGVALYKTPPQSIGKKMLKATISLKNTETGEVTTAMSEYEYEVLPQCKKSCQ